jgi:hypothetical protein
MVGAWSGSSYFSTRSAVARSIQTRRIRPGFSIASGHTRKFPYTNVPKLRYGVRFGGTVGSSARSSTPKRRVVPTGQIRNPGFPLYAWKRPRISKHSPFKSARPSHRGSAAKTTCELHATRTTSVRMRFTRRPLTPHFGERAALRQECLVRFKRNARCCHKCT